MTDPTITDADKQLVREILHAHQRAMTPPDSGWGNMSYQKGSYDHLPVFEAALQAFAAHRHAHTAPLEALLKKQQDRADSQAEWVVREAKKAIAIEKRMQELEEALRPFAAEAANHDRSDIADQDGFAGDIYFGDLRRARKALEGRGS